MFFRRFFKFSSQNVYLFKSKSVNLIEFIVVAMIS